jgi:hypothetical protein
MGWDRRPGDLHGHSPPCVIGERGGGVNSREQTLPQDERCWSTGIAADLFRIQEKDLPGHFAWQPSRLPIVASSTSFCCSAWYTGSHDSLYITQE